MTDTESSAIMAGRALVQLKRVQRGLVDAAGHSKLVVALETAKRGARRVVVHRIDLATVVAALGQFVLYGFHESVRTSLG